MFTKCFINFFFFFGTVVLEKENLVPGVLALGVGRRKIEPPIKLKHEDVKLFVSDLQYNRAEFPTWLKHCWEEYAKTWRAFSRFDDALHVIK